MHLGAMLEQSCPVCLFGFKQCMQYHAIRARLFLCRPTMMPPFAFCTSAFLLLLFDLFFYVLPALFVRIAMPCYAAFALTTRCEPSCRVLDCISLIVRSVYSVYCLYNYWHYSIRIVMPPKCRVVCMAGYPCSAMLISRTCRYYIRSR